jgi:hypothetical protein
VPTFIIIDKNNQIKNEFDTQTRELFVENCKSKIKIEVT